MKLCNSFSNVKNSTIFVKFILSSVTLDYAIVSNAMKTCTLCRKSKTRVILQTGRFDFIDLASIISSVSKAVQ